ncbi:MAG: zinc-ribbon domain-containing protein [Candidatus Hodarchaeota archaeon]
MPEEITPEREEVEEPRRVLPSDVLCSYCGYVNPAGAKFCIRCGRNLE